MRRAQLLLLALFLGHASINTKDISHSGSGIRRVDVCAVLSECSTCNKKHMSLRWESIKTIEKDMVFCQDLGLVAKNGDHVAVDGLIVGTYSAGACVYFERKLQKYIDGANDEGVIKNMLEDLKKQST